VIAARVHPGVAVLLAVAGVTAALLILQSVKHRDAATTASVPVSSPVAPASSPVVSSPSPVAPVSFPQPLSGIARVIDGDTIEIRGTHIRLNGIDAPET
jgi:endonuclease YncB( thermonuclease family)